MNIPNYDNKTQRTKEKFYQLEDCLPDQCFRMLICGASGTGKKNTLIHMLLKPLIYYDKIYLYENNLEQDKYNLLTERLNKITNKHMVLLEGILFSSNNEIIPVDEMDTSGQKVIFFYDYVCEKNQNGIINYFIQGRQKNCCVIYLSQSYYKTPKDIRLNCPHYIIFEAPREKLCQYATNKVYH